MKYTAYRLAKGHLLRRKTRPFAQQKTTYCKPTGFASKNNGECIA